MQRRVLGVLGGGDLGEDAFRAWAASADFLFAADSGADRLIALGFSPVVVGDFDSFASLPDASGLRLVQSIDLDTTDCDKLLALIEKEGHTAVTLTGTEGDLPDHVLATYASAIKSGLDVRFAFRRGLGILVRPGRPASFAASLGQRVSFLPLLECERARLTGVAWPLDGDTIALGAKISVSNEALGGTVEAEIGSGAALLFLECHEVVW